MLILDRRKIRRKLTPTTNPFLSLARSIIYQQISTKAGNSIHERFLKLFPASPRLRRTSGEITPQAFLKLSDAELVSAGLSPQKRSYLKDLAEKFLDGTVNPELFSEMTDEEIKEHLIRVKGIGPWTADMFLIFALNRPNILPVGDLGIRKGFKKAFKLKKLPAERQMRRLALPYEGRYTYLSLYLWESLENK